MEAQFSGFFVCDETSTGMDMNGGNSQDTVQGDVRSTVLPTEHIELCYFHNMVKDDDNDHIFKSILKHPNIRIVHFNVTVDLITPLDWPAEVMHEARNGRVWRNMARDCV